MIDGFLDFDNTCMGTEQHAVPSLIARFNSLYQDQIDHPLTFTEFKKHFHGQARETLCDNLSRHFNIVVDYKTLYDTREWRMMDHYKNLQGGVPMAPGLLPALRDLQLSNVQFSLVTNNPIQRALAAMRYADNMSGDELAAHFGTRLFEAGDNQKPRPDVYLTAMQQIDAVPERSFAVEDSVTGVKSAVAANISATFGYTGFADDPQQMGKTLTDNGCIEVFHDWSAFPAMVRRHFKSSGKYFIL
jgi:HAD superfamily hydrolase (TIGR01509 family)